MSIESQLKKNIPEVISKFPSIQVMYLFGSHASGKHRNDSDVDVAVFTDGRESPFMDLELGLFLQQRIRRPVDVVIMQKVSPILRHEVLRRKIRIFEKDPVNRAVWEAKAFNEFMDAIHYQRKRSNWRKLNGQHSPHTAAAE